DYKVTGVQTCALPIWSARRRRRRRWWRRRNLNQPSNDASDDATNQAALDATFDTVHILDRTRRLWLDRRRRLRGRGVVSRRGDRSEERRVGKECRAGW